jgi:DNA-binding phage protein
MPSNDFHPFKRIRESFRGLSEESGMKNYASTAGFANWLGRSPSLIRNVENGNATLSKHLAAIVEYKTGVSAAWLLSDDASGPGEIMAKTGLPWNPVDYLDPYSSRGLLSYFGILLDKEPHLVPALVGAVVEARIMMELVRGGLIPQQKMEQELHEKGENPALETFEVLRKVLMAVQLIDENEKKEFENFFNEAIDSRTPSKKLKDIWGTISMMERWTRSR